MARLVANVADEDKEKLPVEQQPKCTKLSSLLPKDWFSFSVDDKDLEEAMKTYSGKNTALNNTWALKNFEDCFKAKWNKTEVPLEVLLTDDPTRSINRSMSLPLTPEVRVGLLRLLY